MLYDTTTKDVKNDIQIQCLIPCKNIEEAVNYQWFHFYLLDSLNRCYHIK